MAEMFLVEIVSPSKLLLSEEVEEVTAPGTEGEFGVLAGHTPMLTSLKAGKLSYRKGGKSESMAISRGYAEVLPDKTTILVDDAVTPDEIRVDEAREMLTRANEEMGGLESNDPKYEIARGRAEYAEAQIGVTEGR